MAFDIVKIPGFVTRCDPDGTIASEVYRDLRMMATDRVGGNLLAWVDDDSRPKAQAFFDRMAADGMAYDWELNFVFDGEIVLMHLWGISLSDGPLILAARSRSALDQLYGILMLLDDPEHAALRAELASGCIVPAVSAAPDESLYEELSRANNEMVNLQRELARANADLKSAVETLDAFARTVAHDLRTPLFHMQSFAQAVAEDYASALDAQGQQYLQWVTEAAAKMETMVDGILQYSRLSHSELPIKPADLSQVAHEACNQVLGAENGKGAVVEVQDAMPKALGHHGILVQVVANLVGNAVKYVKPGQQPRVRIWAEPRQSNRRRVVLWVEDNGIGIAPRYQERIFRLFGRVDSAGAYEGTGVGLATVRMMTEKMGGRVGVESQEGVGSRCWIELASAEGVNP